MAPNRQWFSPQPRSATTTWSDLPKDQWPDWMNTPIESDFPIKRSQAYIDWKNDTTSKSATGSNGVFGAAATPSASAASAGAAGSAAGGASAGLTQSGLTGSNENWTVRNVKDPTRQTALDEALSGLADSTKQYKGLFDDLQTQNDESRAKTRTALDQENATVNSVFNGEMADRLASILTEKTKAVNDIANTMRAGALRSDSQRGMMEGGAGSSYRSRVLDTTLTKLYQDEAQKAADAKLSNLQYLNGLQSSLLGARQRGESNWINQGGAVAAMRSPIEQALAAMLSNNVNSSLANNFYGLAKEGGSYTGALPTVGGYNYPMNYGGGYYPNLSAYTGSNMTSGAGAVPSRSMSINPSTYPNLDWTTMPDGTPASPEPEWMRQQRIQESNTVTTPAASLYNPYGQYGYGGEFSGYGSGSVPAGTGSTPDASLYNPYGDNGYGLNTGFNLDNELASLIPNYGGYWWSGRN